MWQSGQKSCILLPLCDCGHVLNLSEPPFPPHGVTVRQEDKCSLTPRLLKKAPQTPYLILPSAPHGPPTCSVIYLCVTFTVCRLTAPLVRQLLWHEDGDPRPVFQGTPTARTAPRRQQTVKRENARAPASGPALTAS